MIQAENIYYELLQYLSNPEARVYVMIVKKKSLQRFKTLFLFKSQNLTYDNKLFPLLINVYRIVFLHDTS